MRKNVGVALIVLPSLPATAEKPPEGKMEWAPMVPDAGKMPSQELIWLDGTTVALEHLPASPLNAERKFRSTESSRASEIQAPQPG